MSFISSSSSSPYSNFSTALNSPTPNLLSLDSAETLSPPSTSSCFYGVPDYLQCHTSDYTMPPHEFAGDYSTSVNPYFASFQQFQAYNNCWMAQNVYNTTYPTPPSTPPDDETNAPDSTKEELPESTEFPDFVDTIELCKQIRETMKTDGISQVEFAKNVLNRGQGTFSQILKCPKPWKELDAGRRVYVQMKRWLEQSQEVRVAMAKGRGGKECKENNDAVPEAQNKRFARLEFS
uniref:CUT domain-containing protein n=1 Tax=Caenorhabditis japonica TaxID=281687 RepID=A0A8R1ID24_CAEJA